MVKRMAFYMQWLNAPESQEAEWNQWLDKIQVPALLQIPGFVFARRYVAIEGDRKYFHLYGLADADVLKSKPYLDLRKREPSAGFVALTERTPGILRGVYEQIYPSNKAFQGARADTILTVGIDVPSEKDEEFNTWYNTDHIPANLRSPGWLSAYRFVATREELSPGRKATGARYVALWELEKPDVFSSPEFRKSIDSPWTRWVHTWYTRRQRAIYRSIP